MFGDNTITAELLRALLKTEAANVSRGGIARETSMGWILSYEAWVLRSARIAGSPRYFQTLDALVRVARDLGLNVLGVNLVGDDSQAETVAPRKLVSADGARRKRRAPGGPRARRAKAPRGGR